jgi:hypothetical protein
LSNSPDSCAPAAKKKGNRDLKKNPEFFYPSIEGLDYKNFVDITPADEDFVSGFINESIIEFVEGWGFSKKKSALDAHNWNNCIDSFYRYNLPLEVWDSIVPQKWKLNLCNSDTFKNTETEILNKKNQSLGEEESQSYSIYAKNPLLKDRINNYNKRFKYIYLLNSFTDFLRDGHTQQFATQQDSLKQTIESKLLIDGLYDIFDGLDELAGFDDVFEAIPAYDEIKEIDPFDRIDEFGGIHRIQIIPEISNFYAIDPFPGFGDIEDIPDIEDITDVEDIPDVEDIGYLNEIAYAENFYQQKNNESEIKINSIFDLKLWIVPDPMEFHNFFLKRIESNLSFSSTKKEDTEKKTSNNLELKSNNLDLTPNSLDLTPNNLDLTPNSLDLTPNNLELTPNSLDLTPNNLELTPNNLELDDSFKGILKQKYDITLKKRESLNYLSRWKWKSKALEGKLEDLRNFMVLVDVLENDQDLIAFRSNTGIKSDLLSLFFDKNRRNIAENLCFYCAHRLVPISKDHILIYRTINLLRKFNEKLKNQFKKRVNNEMDSEPTSALSLTATEKSKKLKELEEQYSSYNVEDVLLSGRRRELRFLQSVVDMKTPGLEEHFSDSLTGVEQSCGSETHYPSDICIMKRFLWPSYRLEELACIGRFCLNISNGSCFTTLKLRMYPTAF